MQIGKMTGPASSHTSQDLKEKTIKSVMDFYDWASRVLQIDYEAVYVHKNGTFQGPAEWSSVDHWLRDRLLLPKLKGDSYGEFNFMVELINTNYFDSRAKFDDVFEKGSSKDPSVTMIECISLEEVLKLMEVEFSCNMDYYLSNKEEMEKDLGRQLEKLDITNKDLMKQLDSELLYNQVMKIFGQESVDDSAIEQSSGDETRQKFLNFREFHLLYSDGNYKIATARRGDYYVRFLFEC